MGVISMRRSWVVLLPIFAAVSLVGLPVRAEPSSQAQEVTRERDEAPAHPTAEDVLRALQRRRPTNTVIPPASASPPGLTGQSKLWPEGVKVVNRTGGLRKQGEWWVFAFADGEEPPMKLLPNAALESVVRTAVGSSVRLSFVVSGELTVFENENYLLLDVAMRATGSAGDGENDGATGAQPDPAQPPATPGVAEDASAEEIEKLLRAQRPDMQMIPVDRSETRAGDLASGSGGATVPDGTPLISRPGRLVRDGRWWTFVFESDRREYPEPPMRLLPNQHLESMLRASGRGVNGVVFVVSGEVTLFVGENYLLARAVMRRMDMGNLRK